ncbi:YlxR family protein [Actinomycetospora lutea]|nr:YlxR family protein [Actinomycetospora lutea]MDD7938975.1 YlxR family protein [Actinomycetospora lutea]
MAPDRDGRDDVHGPVRTCIGCRSRASASELLRVVAADGIVDPDPRHRKPGRGAWVHPDPDCLDRAERRSAFPRALRVPGPLDTGALHALLDPADTPPTGHDRRDDRRVRTRKQVDPHEPAVKPSR